MFVCDAVCQIQLDRQLHYYLEQPSGSDMMYQSEMYHGFEHTYRATCDQRTAGNLKHPRPTLPLKKNMQVFTAHLC